MKRLFLLLGLVWASCAVAHAQDLTVKSFELLETDMAAKLHPVKDLNGEDCALIRVCIATSDVLFSGNIMGEPVSDRGEYLLYVPARTKWLKIAHANYMFTPMKYLFPIEIKSNYTYELRLEIPVVGYLNQLYGHLGENLAQAIPALQSGGKVSESESASKSDSSDDRLSVAPSEMKAEKESEERGDANPLSVDAKVEEGAPIRNAKKPESEDREFEKPVSNPMQLESQIREGLSDEIYAIGDLYNKNGVTGVVFQVDESGRHGKVVALEEFRGAWGSGVRTHAKSRTDGLSNTKSVKASAEDWRTLYPLFASCVDLGEGWYLPAIKELRELLLNDRNRNLVNQTLKENSAAPLPDRDKMRCYWSSTERNKRNAWNLGMEYGDTVYEEKDKNYRARAVYRF